MGFEVGIQIYVFGGKGLSMGDVEILNYGTNDLKWQELKLPPNPDYPQYYIGATLI